MSLFSNTFSFSTNVQILLYFSSSNELPELILSLKALNASNANGKSIFSYAPSCNGAEDYLKLAQEIEMKQVSLYSATGHVNERTGEISLGLEAEKSLV